MSIYNSGLLVAALVLLTPFGARGGDCTDHGPTGEGAHAASIAAPTATAIETQATATRGVITAINTKNKKITLRHEDIKDFNMSAMTMNFVLGPGVSIEGLAVKDTVLFKLKNEKGSLTITHIEKTSGGY